MKNTIFSLVLRYLLLLILGLGNLFIFYLIFTPLTIYSVFGLISRFYDVVILIGNPTQACDIAINFLPFLKSIACMNTTIFFKGYFASIIPACIAGSAYYLLLILNLSTPMSKKQRIKSILFLMSSFLFLNILRIFGFALLYANKGLELFNIAHIAFWYFGSTILIILLWFTNVMLFNIKNIPIYTDFKMILNQIRGKK
ncbi:pacearchaeosortase [Candidatus Pacearchaeota archaeon]|nr:pacearchaeosortase [Candidatus Pacearchaeota archaeon]